MKALLQIFQRISIKIFMCALSMGLFYAAENGDSKVMAILSQAILESGAAEVHAPSSDGRCPEIVTKLTNCKPCICEGETSKFLISISGGTPPYSFKFADKHYKEISKFPYAVKVKPYTKTTYQVTHVRDADCCRGENSERQFVKVKPAPRTHLSATPTTLFGPGVVDFSIDITDGVPPYSFVFNGKKYRDISHFPFVIPVTVTESGRYQVTDIVGHNDCKGKNSNCVCITVLPVPEVTLSVSAPSLCGGGEVIFTVNTTCTGAYSFNFNGVHYEDVTTVPFTIPVTVDTTQRFTVTDFVCSTGGTVAASNSVTVTVYPIPVVYITGQTSYLAGQTITLTAHSSQPIESVTWTVPRGTFVENPLVLPNAQPSDSGLYHVRIVDEHGCVGTAVDPVVVTQGGALSLVQSYQISACIITYTIKVTNTGNGAAQNVVIQDTLPPGFTFINASGVPSYTVSGNIVTATVPTLAPGATITFQMQAQITQCGLSQNSVTVTANGIPAVYNTLFVHISTFNR